MSGHLLIRGDARALPLGRETVDCVVTSPPYWGLRDYGVEGQLGQEAVLDCLGWATGDPCGECWVCHLVAVGRELRRVLRPWGTFWLNVGDAYAARPCRAAIARAKPAPAGFKTKDLLALPWRVALALQADGWWLRSEIIWHKSNPMPESCTDRPSRAHETIFLLTRRKRYFYDRDAVAAPAAKLLPRSSGRHVPGAQQDGLGRGYQMPEKWTTGRSPLKTVWTVATQARPEAHFATFPDRLVERCILAGTSARGNCPACGRPWERVVERTFEPQQDVSPSRLERAQAGCKPMDATNGWAGTPRGTTKAETQGWRPTCACEAGGPVPAVVLDPFAGSGTTPRVAEELGRIGVGIELSEPYLTEIARPRCAAPVQRALVGAA